MSTLIPAGRSPSIIDVFQQMEKDANRKEPGRPARLAREREEKAARRAADRVKIIARYGSKEAAVSGGDLERLLDAATKSFQRKVRKRYDNGTFDTDSLDGWTGPMWDFRRRPPPRRVIDAVEGAHPLPTTIAEAAAECRHWEARNRELEIIHDFYGADSMLPLACGTRQEIVLALMQTGLRAVSLQDAIVRMRYLVEAEHDGGAPDGMPEAVLADMEALAGAGMGIHGVAGPGRMLMGEGAIDG